jgi:hypothetical protein
MNLKKPQRNKSTGTRVCVLIPSTTAITSAPAPAPAITTTSIAAAVIPGMAVTVERAMATAFAAGITPAGRIVMTRSWARLFAVPLKHHNPVGNNRSNHDDQRQ